MHKPKNLSKYDFPFPYPCLLLSVRKTVKIIKEGVRRSGHVLLFTSVVTQISIKLSPRFYLFFLWYEMFFMICSSSWSSWPATFDLSEKNFHFYIIFKGPSPVTVITKHWLYSLCCPIRPQAYLTPNSCSLWVKHWLEFRSAFVQILFAESAYLSLITVEAFAYS